MSDMKGPDEWSSHQRTLIRAAVRTPGDIVEMGMGHYSSPLLSEIAAARGDRLDCYETNEAWMRALVPMLHTSTVYAHVGAYTHHLVGPNVGLVFLDGYGPSRDRWPLIAPLVKHIKTVVVHDAHRPPLKEIRSLFKYVDVVRTPYPPTLIASHLPGVVA